MKKVNMERVKLCIFGFGPLALSSIMKLSESYDILSVITYPDMSDESLDKYCAEKRIKLFYNNPQKEISFFKNQFINCQSDILVSINYRYIIPKSIYSFFRYAINIHGSMLPKYRGRTPHVWAIINGENSTGITVHIIEEKVDSGPIIVQEKVSIGNDDSGYDLLMKFKGLYPVLIHKALDKLLRNGKLLGQNESKATYFGKRIPEMGYIDTDQQTKKILNFIRAQRKPYPGAYYYDSQGNKIVIHRVRVLGQVKGNSSKLERINDRIVLHCRYNTLEIIDFEWK